MAKVDPIPAYYPRVTPYLTIDGAAKAIDFYTDILGATVRGRMDGPDGKVGHAELDLGGSVIMLADSFPDMGALDPRRPTQPALTRARTNCAARSTSPAPTVRTRSPGRTRLFTATAL